MQKQQQQQQQQQQQEEEEEKEEEKEEEVWTQIPTKSKRHRRREPTLLSPTNHPLKDLTLTQLTAEFHSKLRSWQTSSCRKTLFALLARIQPSEGEEVGWKLKKAICLGSGSLSRENWECRRRSVWQVVVFYDLATYLLNLSSPSSSSSSEERGKGDRGIMYAQEPAFTPLDRDFLHTLGVHILESKLGEGGEGMGSAGQELGPNSFLFEPFVDMNVKMLEIMLRKGVGLYMGSSIRGILERRGGSAVGKLAGKFAEGREMRKFPGFELEPNVLEGMGIYWMEQGEDADGE